MSGFEWLPTVLSTAAEAAPLAELGPGTAAEVAQPLAMMGGSTGLNLSDALSSAGSGLKEIGNVAPGLKSLKDLFGTKQDSNIIPPTPFSPRASGEKFQPSAPYFAAGLPAPEISPASDRLAELRRRLSV